MQKLFLILFLVPVFSFSMDKNQQEMAQATAGLNTAMQNLESIAQQHKPESPVMEKESTPPQLGRETIAFAENLRKHPCYFICCCCIPCRLVYKCLKVFGCYKESK